MEAFNSGQPHQQKKLDTNSNLTTSSYNNPCITYNFKGIPGCQKCNGTGFKISNKKPGKQKLCSSCIKGTGVCPKCNNSGFKIGNPNKVCKCKEKASKKAEKKIKKEKL